MITPKQADEILRLALALADASADILAGESSHEEEQALRAYIDPLVGEDEPVAWRMRDEFGSLVDIIDPEEHARQPVQSPRCEGCGDEPHPNFPCDEAAALRDPQPPVQQHRPMTKQDIDKAAYRDGRDASEVDAFIDGIEFALDWYGIGDEA